MRGITRPGVAPTPGRAGRALIVATSGAVVSLIAAGLVAGAAASPIAQVSIRGAFDRSGLIVASGRAVRISGPITCAAGDTVRVRATVSQLVTGAVAEGFWSKRCTGASQHWHLTATITDGVSVEAGCARGAGLAISERRGKAVTAVQWISQVSLAVAGSAGAGSPSQSC